MSNQLKIQRQAKTLELKLPVRQTKLIDQANPLTTIKARNLNNIFAYGSFFFLKSMIGLTRKQEVKQIGDKVYKSHFTIDHSEHKKWQDCFAVKDAKIPFGLYLKSSALIFFEIMKDHKINLKNVLQLRNQFTFSQAITEYRPGNYLTTVKQLEVIPAGKKNIIMGFHTSITNSEGEIIQEVLDYFMVRNIEEKNLNNLKSELKPSDTNYRAWKLKPKLGDSENIIEKTVRVQEKMGLTYGKVSGDLNMAHTTKTMAKFFGFKSAFVQGLCSLHFVIAHHPKADQLSNIMINYLAPVYTGQSISIHFGESGFIVYDSNKKHCAHGTYELKNQDKS